MQVGARVAGPGVRGTGSPASSRVRSTSTVGRTPSTGGHAADGSCGGASTEPDTTGDATLGSVSDSPVPAPRSTSGRSRFDERLSVPLWWYLAAIGVAVLLGAEIHMGYPGIRSWIGYALCVPVAVLALVLLGRTRVRVADGTLHVGSAAKELRHLGRAEIVPKAEPAAGVGPGAGPDGVPDDPGLDTPTSSGSRSPTRTTRRPTGYSVCATPPACSPR